MAMVQGKDGVKMTFIKKQFVKFDFRNEISRY